MKINSEVKWSEVKHGYLKRKNILLFLVGKVFKSRVQQNAHAWSHCDLCNRGCSSCLSWYRHSHSDTHDSPVDLTFKGVRVILAAWILYHPTTITVFWLTEFFLSNKTEKCYHFTYILLPYCFFCILFPEGLGFFFLVCILRFYFGTGFLMLPCMYIIRFSEVYSIISVSMPLHHINTTCLQNLTLGLTSCLLDSVILYYFFYQCI